jgi:hypothetical protein
MRRLISAAVIALFALSLTGPALAGDKEKQEPVKAQPAAPKQKQPATKQEAPRKTTSPQKPKSVDRFIDKDNDGVNDRRERKVVREPKPSTVKPQQKPQADPKRERTTTKRQAPPR